MISKQLTLNYNFTKLYSGLVLISSIHQSEQVACPLQGTIGTHRKKTVVTRIAEGAETPPCG